MFRIRIYFAGSIRGARRKKDQVHYRQLIEHLQSLGEVLTEHVGETTAKGEDSLPNRYIHNRDMRWLSIADVVVAEVTKPSLGVGYEIRRAIELRKPVLCLYRPEKTKKLSAMIAGSPRVTLYKYSSIATAKPFIEKFISRASRQSRLRRKEQQNLEMLFKFTKLRPRRYVCRICGKFFEGDVLRHVLPKVKQHWKSDHKVQYDVVITKHGRFLSNYLT
jgi:hypothetical protein